MRRWAIGLAAAAVATGAISGCGSSGKTHTSSSTSTTSTGAPTSSSTTGSGDTTTSTGPGSSSGGGIQIGGSADLQTPSSVTLNGAGANSIGPFFEKVFFDYHKANSKTTVQYSPAGSSVGAKDIEQNTVDFADSEIPLSSTDLAAATGGAILQIPVDLGGVAISYNLPNVASGLKLDGATLAGIFAGTITKWNDPAIAKVSGNSNLPDTAIVPVHRADSSGPGYVFDDYLIKTAPDWAAKSGSSKPAKTWPLASVGLGEQLNTGVANYIHQTPGAIGYVEYGYALKAGFTNVALQNKDGSFVEPSLTSIAAAGSQAGSVSATNFDITDEPGSGTYPLANFSWTLVYQKQSDKAKGEALGKLIDYVVTTGQQDAGPLGYATLPANVATVAQQAVHQIQDSSGNPLFAS